MNSFLNGGWFVAFIIIILLLGGVMNDHDSEPVEGHPYCGRLCN